MGEFRSKWVGDTERQQARILMTIRALGQWLKHHHVLHHYQDFTKRFGVSTPLWDYVFGTIERGRNELVPDR